jgi:hypothetical protein
MKPITLLEKLALLSIGAAAAFKALLWSLNQTADSSDWYIVRLRVIFAALSFVAFDLVIGAVVLRGWSKSGAIALLVAAAVSAALALAVAGVWTEPALHAAPALTLAAFGLHLMWIRREAGAGAADTSAPAEPNAAPVAQATAAVQVNVAPAAQLPRTIAAYIAARAAELPQYSQAQIAAELGTSADTIRRAMERASLAESAAAE